jgi:hypothetical protein
MSPISFAVASVLAGIGPSAWRQAESGNATARMMAYAICRFTRSA